MSIKDGTFLYNNKDVNLHNFFSRYLGINISRDIFSYKNDYIILYKIYEQIGNGNIKIFADNIEHISNQFLLKIAGIWETEYNYGLTYKFILL